MSELSKYLVEGILREAEQGIIVLLPGGFKPPHGGHLDLAMKYAALPQVSEVRILIGPKGREGITRERMKRESEDRESEDRERQRMKRESEERDNEESERG